MNKVNILSSDKGQKDHIAPRPTRHLPLSSLVIHHPGVVDEGGAAFPARASAPVRVSAAPRARPGSRARRLPCGARTASPQCARVTVTDDRTAPARERARSPDHATGGGRGRPAVVGLLLLAVLRGDR